MRRADLERGAVLEELVLDAFERVGAVARSQEQFFVHRVEHGLAPEQRVLDVAVAERRARDGVRLLACKHARKVDNTHACAYKTAQTNLNPLGERVGDRVVAFIWRFLNPFDLQLDGQLGLDVHVVLAAIPQSELDGPASNQAYNLISDEKPRPVVDT